MATMISSGTDVVAFLKAQHEEIKALFDEVLTEQGQERQRAFFALRRLLAVHETAEEEIVHPAARSALPNGEAIVAERLKEENEAKKVLTKLETMDVDSTDFEMLFDSLQESVLMHAESEEAQEFAQLADRFDQARLKRMQTAVKVAEAIAPTRPHAGVESATMNLLTGPFAAMMDRARDAFSGKA
jgi:hemerythrin superfamily protein